MGLYSIKDFESGGILSEAYVPKSKDLKRAEEILDKIRAPYLLKDTSGITGIVKINAERFRSISRNLCNSRDWKELENCLERQFGFEVFTVNILRESSINAYTMPVAIDVTRLASFDDVLEPSGLKYKESAKISGISFVSEGLLFNSAFTSGQVLSIILHEIGHNFSHMGISFLTYYKTGIGLYHITTLMLSLFDITDRRMVGQDGNDLDAVDKLYEIFKYLMYGTNYGKEITAKVKRSKEYKDYNTIYDAVLAAQAIRKDVTYIPQSFKMLKEFINIIFANPILKLYKNALRQNFKNLENNMGTVAKNQAANYLNFMDESFADKFVAMNGYGVEFAGAVKILEAESLSYGITGFVDKIPLVGHVFALDHIIANFFGTILSGEPHPTATSRVKTQISILEEELKNPDLTPKTRKIIERDLKDIKRETERIDELLSKRIKITNSAFRYYVLLFNKLITAIQPDGDIREFLMRGVNSNAAIMKKLKISGSDFTRSIPRPDKILGSLKRDLIKM